MTANKEEQRLVVFDESHLDAVYAIERRAHAFAWTRGNFVDALESGYLCRCAVDADASLVGYLIAMPGVDEMQVLNLTVAPEHQGRGHGRYMLDRLVMLCYEARVSELLLEVRTSNTRARKLYALFGLSEIGARKDYYLAPSTIRPQQREDAVVMRLRLNEETR